LGIGRAKGQGDQGRGQKFFHSRLSSRLCFGGCVLVCCNITTTLPVRQLFIDYFHIESEINSAIFHCIINALTAARCEYGASEYH
jgi:hypothetical protein